uniref:Uncharacterized protein n=1 Tax=viral metagenome TaxID=1070528 RepID=A0A6C0FDT4_9ZZZZ
MIGIKFLYIYIYMDIDLETCILAFLILYAIYLLVNRVFMVEGITSENCSKTLFRIRGLNCSEIKVPPEVYPPKSMNYKDGTCKDAAGSRQIEQQSKGSPHHLTELCGDSCCTETKYVICPENNIWDGEKCDECPPGSVPDGAKCKECPNTQIAKNGKCQCPENHIWNGKKCNKCPPGNVPEYGKCVLSELVGCSGKDIKIKHYIDNDCPYCKEVRLPDKVFKNYEKDYNEWNEGGCPPHFRSKNNATVTEKQIDCHNEDNCCKEITYTLKGKCKCKEPERYPYLGKEGKAGLYGAKQCVRPDGAFDPRNPVHCYNYKDFTHCIASPGNSCEWVYSY